MKMILLVVSMMAAHNLLANDVRITFNHCIRTITVHGKYDGHNIRVFGVYNYGTGKVVFRRNSNAKFKRYHLRLLHILFGGRTVKNLLEGCAIHDIKCVVINQRNCSKDRI